ncbi:MAG: HEPN domain-containing protein [Nitrososphaerota archaeon]
MNNIRREAKDWFDGAVVDLEEARSALLNSRVNWALFAAHQAVEKALKAAFMVLKRDRPPKTHDLVRLLGELGLELSEDLKIGISELSPYYVLARYPNAGLERPWESIDKALAERLVTVAEDVVRIVGRIAGLG